MSTETAVVVSYGEIGTKSRPVRGRMASRLRESLASALRERDVPGEVERPWARLVVRTESPRRAARVASEVPGVVWARPARTCEPTLGAIRATLRDAAADVEGATFAVRANRDGSVDHGFTSPDIEREGGGDVDEATAMSVDLDDPDVTFRVDCRRDEAFVSVESVAGPGGLPPGTQGRAVALVSGGIDSPVAAWETMRRGCSVVPVYVSLGDYGGADHEARAVEVTNRLARRVPDEDVRLRVVPAGDVVETLVSEVGETRMLSLRRVMLVAAAGVADLMDAHSVVTGESLGQKSSQTGPNLAVTDAAVDLPVHRPLLTWDKADIVAAARDLGTFADSTLPVGCERVAPDRPATAATLEAVEAAEPPDLLERAAAAVEDRYLG